MLGKAKQRMGQLTRARSGDSADSEAVEDTQPAAADDAPVDDTADETVVVPVAQDDWESVDNDDRITRALDQIDYTESEEFPLLQQVLLRYFRNLGSRIGARDVAFIKKYRKYGEKIAEFDGLAEELRTAYRYPKRVTPMLNEALATDLHTQDVRKHMLSLYEQITETGEYSSEVKAQKREDAKAESADPDDLLSEYWFKRVNPIPGPGRKYFFPMWAALVGSFALLVISVTGFTYIAWPAWLVWLPSFVAALGLVGLALSSVAMRNIRQQMLHPERDQQREAARKRYEEKRLEKQAQRDRLRDLLGP